MAMVPTLGSRYQQGWPRRVRDESMMSSETRKKACRSSVSQPRVAAAWKVDGASEGVEERSAVVSRTEMPRLALPPRAL